MSSITKKEINGHEFMFINSSRGNRSGFVHESELYLDGNFFSGFLGKNKVQYYNRTWECYTYQSVMKGLVSSLLENLKEAWKATWKDSHNVKRLTKDKAAAMWNEFEENKPDRYKNLEDLYAAL